MAPKGIDARPDRAISVSLLLFSVPILASSVAQSVATTVNSAWIGRLLGAQSLTASTVANSLLTLVLSVGAGLGLAVGILVAQCLGGGKVCEAKRSTGTAIVAFAVLAIVAATTGILAAPQLLRMLHTPDDALQQAIIYLRLILLGLPALYLYTCLTMVLRAGGDPWTPFIFLLLAAMLDACLNPLLITGFGPLPALGIAGSALATVISQWLMVGSLVVWIYAKRHALCLRGAELRYLRMDAAILRTLVIKGAPIGVQTIVIASSLTVMIGLVNQFGSLTVAAYAACFHVWNYVQIPGLAVSAAVSSMAAQNIGAQRWDRVRVITVTGVAYGAVLALVLAATVFLWGDTAFALFLGADSQTIALARHIHALMFWSFPLFAVAFVLMGVMRAAGAVVAPLVILVAALWIVRVPAALILMPSLGADGVFLSTPVAALGAVAMTLIYFRLGRWRRAAMWPA